VLAQPGESRPPWHPAGRN